MRNNGKHIWLVLLSCALLITGCQPGTSKDKGAISNMVSSPDGRLLVQVDVDAAGKPFYSVQLDGKEVLRPSPLGLVRSDMSFADGLTLVKTSRLKTVEDEYTMLTGKQRDCRYRANRQTFTLENSDGQTMQVIFQVSNDGVAFRYGFNEKTGGAVSITDEKTGFAFAPAARAWLHPMAQAKTGWALTQPSYEEHYVTGAVGQPSPTGEGWCFPALFKTADGVWVLICDSDVDTNYCGVHLGNDSSGGVYRVAFPQPEEHRGPEDPVAPVVRAPFESPWRVVMVGDLNTLAASTLITDVATPSKIDDTDFVQPGKAAWHWLRYGDESATLEYVNAYLDFAVKMNWEYILVDANWHRLIGYEKIADFVKEAKDKNVDVILWYNSNGSWNDAPQGPKHKMHERSVRREEFARISEMGVKGVKVDFFGGDKQATMKLYLYIFEDAADYGILVNCHGATIPRGWQRTWPNLATMESVKGMEFCTFEQANADRQPSHCCILPFTRNVIGSMDFTPVVFNPRIRGVRLVTTPGFELALSVVFESGVQHFGLSPDEYDLMPDYVVDFLREVPTVWDETRLVDGYPGEYVVMARRSGNTWYIGGINGTGDEKQLTLDLSFLPENAKARMITDGTMRTFALSTLYQHNLNDLTVKMKTNGGFVIVIE